MEKRRALLAALLAGLLPVAPASMSYAATCIVLPHEPIRLRHVCGLVLKSIKEAIPDAKVMVLKGGKEVATVQADTDGKFSFERLDAGNYDVRVEAAGYATAQDSVVIAKTSDEMQSGLASFSQFDSVLHRAQR